MVKNVIHEPNDVSEFASEQFFKLFQERIVIPMNKYKKLKERENNILNSSSKNSQILKVQNPEEIMRNYIRKDDDEFTLLDLTKKIHNKDSLRDESTQLCSTPQKSERNIASKTESKKDPETFFKNQIKRFRNRSNTGLGEDLISPLRSKIMIKRGSIDVDEDKKKLILKEMKQNQELTEIRTQMMLFEPKSKF